VTEDMVIVHIHASTEEEAKEMVFLGHNGSSILIPRGQDAKIPGKFLNVLKDAKRYVYSQLSADNEEGLGTRREVQSYPYTATPV
jgi:hypothetical protein